MTSVTIDRVLLRQVNLPPKVERTDAIQSFVTQETILLTLVCSDGIQATGYAYTIGTGGSSVVALLKDHLVPRLLGKNPVHIEAIWKDLFFHTHATAVGGFVGKWMAERPYTLQESSSCKRSRHLHCLAPPLPCHCTQGSPGVTC